LSAPPGRPRGRSGPFGGRSLATGLGGKSLVWGPVATAIVWGLAFSTVLTLLVVPLLYRTFMVRTATKSVA